MVSPRFCAALAAVATGLCICLACGCGSGGRTEPLADQSEAPHHLLQKVDSIGIELGDSLYVFGLIRAAGLLTGGEVYVGDFHTFLISLYEQDGSYICSGGGQGEGPGEYNMPTSVVATPWGGLAVADVAAGKLIFFDSCLTLDYEIHGFGRNAPQSIVVLPDSSLVGSRREFDRNAGKIGVGVYRWEAGTTEETATYHTNLVTFDIENISESFEATQVDYAAAPDGRVFVSPISRDSYRVFCYEPDGELYNTIERPYTRTRRSQEDMDREMDMMRVAMERRGRGRALLEEWEPDPYYQAIMDLEVVGDDQLWVRRGFEPVPFFDVYDLDGELLFTCSAEQLPYSIDIALEASEEGVVAFLANPDDYPKVWLLEMVEGSGPSD